MESFSNVNLFFNNCYREEEIPKELLKLSLFTACSKLERELFSKTSLFQKNLNQEDGYSYMFHYEGNSYPFSLFSDYDLQDYDKKILKSNKRYKEFLGRTLKLVCSLDLVSPKVVIGNSLMENFSLLILFSEDGVNKVIDYSKNLVMNQEDYYKIFCFQDINVVDQFDLYQIHYLMDEFQDERHIFEYLIFTKEIFHDLEKQPIFSSFFSTYDCDGIHGHNYLLFGNNHDCLFFQEEDIGRLKYEELVRELNNFTENPSLPSRHISYDKEKSCYQWKDRKFGSFTFSLFSDFVLDSDVKKELLSKNRYHKCHKNSIMVACSLAKKDAQSAYVVGGKFLENEKDYFYHSWVEIDDSNTVIDYNHNIVMNRDKYYDFFGVEVINRILVSDVKDVLHSFIDFGFSFHPMYISYFGQEFMRDFQKNQKILERK